MLALAFLLLEVKDEADIFCLCIDNLYFKTATSGICALQPVLPSRVCVLLTEGGGGETHCLQEFKLDI